MKKRFFLIISSVLYISATAQVHDISTEKIFPVEFKLKPIELNPYSECKLIEKTFSTNNSATTTNSTIMKAEKMPSQRQIKIDYIHKSYEPTLLDAVGSIVYDMLEDKIYNRWD